MLLFSEKIFTFCDFIKKDIFNKYNKKRIDNSVLPYFHSTLKKISNPDRLYNKTKSEKP